jgi:pyroglutamyl-peptidase
MDILVTGFGPFPHVRINPTDRLARAVAERLRRSGLAARALVLETSYGGGLPALRDHLEAERPKAVLMLGVAARARFVRVELFGRGRSSLLHADARGGRPGGMTASRGQPLRTTASASAALAALRRAGIRCRLSPSAGRYLCDASYALALRQLGRSVPVVFVHVPWLRPAPGCRPAGRVERFRPDGHSLEAALATIGRGLAVAGLRATLA